MNSAPMILRLASGSADAGELVEEAVLGVDRDERHLELVAERRDDLLALVLAHQAVVDEDAGQLVADGAVDEHRGDRGVDAAGQPADDLAGPDLLADARDLLLGDRRRRPRAGRSSQTSRRKCVSTSCAVGRVDDLGMELDAVDRRARRLERRDRRLRRRGQRGEAGRRLVDGVAVRHPARLLGPGVRRRAIPGSLIVSSERPYSPTSAPSTRPPSSSASSCMP